MKVPSSHLGFNAENHLLGLSFKSGFCEQILSQDYATIFSKDL